ncbi:hypothetical protein [Longimicrobium sp.]|uniref:hypothetical protein n=1 Tax=Longimicrobium sp. TaxID=2029185 RepID=UPI002E36C90C|nr:hypothetical protein [Longimicrobium sp.]HEX6041065.1 hypothetical protein [Longimicrobium sp.]
MTENLNRLMRLFRWWTSQWWITRDRSFMEAPLRAALSINELGEPLNQLYGYATNIGTLGYERLLDETIFTRVCQAFAIGRDIPISAGAFLDSIYSHSLQNTRQSLFEASIACESAIQEAAAHHAATLQVPVEELERSLKGSDLLFNLDRGVKSILGRSFREDCPEQYDWIRKLWAARGRVAHGKSALIVHDGQRRTPTPEDRVAMIHSVHRLFFWFQSIRSESSQQ